MSEASAHIDGTRLTVQSLQTLVKSKKAKTVISPKALKSLKNQHTSLMVRVKSEPVYGVNTGFGPLANRVLPKSELINLQYNLIRSHAAGAGAPIPERFVRAAMIVRLNTLCRGNSAVTPALVEHLRACINAHITPVVYEHGAVGTSGDLVQLAHIALGLIGEGSVYAKNGTKPSAVALKAARLKPYTLQPKEGLSLINGTAMMTAIGAEVVWHIQRILDFAILNGALALELVGAYGDSLDSKLHALRPHSGQIEIARRLRETIKGSQLIRNRSHIRANVDAAEVTQLSEAIQQVYSLRCIPQIIGPLYDSVEHTKKVVEIELNAVTDNPIFDPNSKTFLHGGNFHGDYIAVALDQLKIPLTKLILLTERRINFFLNEHTNQSFPPFLNLKTPGLNLALQGLQFVATSTAAHSQTAAFPHTVHSIPTNADNQDLVSMGTDAALLAHTVVKNAYILLGIEMTVLAQAVDVLKVKTKLSAKTQDHYNFIRTHMRTVTEDRSLQPELEKLISTLQEN